MYRGETAARIELSIGIQRFAFDTATLQIII